MTRGRARRGRPPRRSGCSPPRSEVLPGGVNSPVRAFRGVGGTPRFIARGEGAWLEDVDGNRYVDLVLSWGPLILGHAHPRCSRPSSRRPRAGTTYGAPTELEVRLAERVVADLPVASRWCAS